MPRSDYFSDELIRQTAQDFAVAYSDHLITIDLRKKDLRGGSVIEDMGTLPSEEDILSYSEDKSSLPSHRYRVWFRDRRFDGLDDLVDKVTRRIDSTNSERKAATKALYSQATLLRREGRIEQVNTGDRDFLRFTSHYFARLGNLEKRVDILTERVNKIPLTGRGKIPR